MLRTKRRPLSISGGSWPAPTRRRRAGSTTATSAKAFRQAVNHAGLQAPGKLTLHSLCHGYASLLIANGLNVVFVSRQLGHANPNIRLEVYAHLFEHADHAQAAREALEATYAANGERKRLRPTGRRAELTRRTRRALITGRAVAAVAAVGAHSPLLTVQGRDPFARGCLG
jgi:hypothetical protein